MNPISTTVDLQRTMTARKGRPLATIISFGPIMPAPAPISDAVKVVQDIDAVVEQLREAVAGDGFTDFQADHDPTKRVYVNAHAVHYVIEP
jgi:hypothetical protein